MTTITRRDYGVVPACRAQAELAELPLRNRRLAPQDRLPRRPARSRGTCRRGALPRASGASHPACELDADRAARHPLADVREQPAERLHGRGGRAQGHGRVRLGGPPARARRGSRSWQLYWATGKQDNGRFPNDVLNAWRRSTGDLGAHKPEAYVAVDIGDARDAAHGGLPVRRALLLRQPAGEPQEAARRGQDDLAVRARAPGRRPGRGTVTRSSPLGYYANGDWDIRSWAKRFRMTKRFMQEYVYLVVRDPLARTSSSA